MFPPNPPHAVDSVFGNHHGAIAAGRHRIEEKLEVLAEPEHLVDGGARVIGYGAPAKASVWLNEMLANQDRSRVHFEYIVDSTPEKIGKFTPGSHIEIMHPSVLQLDFDRGKPPDIVVVLCWNWLDEVLPKIPAGPEVWCRGERRR